MTKIKTFEEWTEGRDTTGISLEDLKREYWQEEGSKRTPRRGYGSHCSKGTRLETRAYEMQAI